MPSFPFPLGSTVLGVVVPPPPPPFWTPVTANAFAWQGSRAGQMPRFERVFPQESGAEQQFVRVPPVNSDDLI